MEVAAETDLVGGKVPSFRPCHVSGLLDTGADLDGPVAVLLAGLVGNDLHAIELKDCAGVFEEPSTGRSNPALKRLGLILGLSVLMERVNVRGSNEGCDSASGVANVMGGIVYVAVYGSFGYSDAGRCFFPASGLAFSDGRLDPRDLPSVRSLRFRCQGGPVITHWQTDDQHYTVSTVSNRFTVLKSPCREWTWSAEAPYLFYPTSYTRAPVLEKPIPSGRPRTSIHAFATTSDQAATQPPSFANLSASRSQYPTFGQKVKKRKAPPVPLYKVWYTRNGPP
ncbi:hypothetical protein KCU83_g45, partial [Aureobasidium melanogenum]